MPTTSWRSSVVSIARSWSRARAAVGPENLLFVGDSELDQAAAKAAGMRFAAYRRDLPAEVQVESHRQLLEWVGR